jgi:hypothetical protein
MCDKKQLEHMCNTHTTQLMNTTQIAACDAYIGNAIVLMHNPMMAQKSNTEHNDSACEKSNAIIMDPATKPTLNTTTQSKNNATQ